MKKYITKLHYEKDLTYVDKILSALLKAVSIPYFIGSEFKNYFYKKGIIKKYRSKSYVISVGNLTTGGTGKTPITAEIANYLHTEGKKVGIVSRGYKGELNNKKPNVISDGKTLFFDAKQAGDEPYWLAKNCQGVGVITCSKRQYGIEEGEKLGFDTFILDDGFQHQKVERDLNILVIDFEKKFGNGLILPAGPLREPLEEICRADKIIVVNKKNNLRGLKGYQRVLERTLKKPVYVCNMKLDIPYNILTGEKYDYENVLAFCAIGQPTQFFNLLSVNYLDTKIFEDHHSYTEKDLEQLKSAAKTLGATALITTEKDAVKIKSLNNADSIKIFAAKLVPELDIEEILI